MKKMKRLLVAMLSCLTAFACVAGLAACGDDDSSSSSTQKSAASSSSVTSTVESSSVEESSSVVESGSEEESSSVEESSKVEESSSAGDSGSAEHVHTWLREPTCLNNGECTVCGIVEQSMLGHSIASWTTEKAASCTEEGSQIGLCTRCELTVTEGLPKLGHEWEIVEAAVEATCTEAGKTAVEKCSRCEATQGGEEVEATGHTPEEVADVAPTCTEAGLTGKTVCSVCNEVVNEGEVVDVLGHTWKDDIAPSCTEGGECTVCGEKVAATGHAKSVFKSQIVPTCEEDGTTTYYYECPVCHEIDKELTPSDYKKILAGHLYGTYVGQKIAADFYADTTDDSYSSGKITVDEAHAASCQHGAVCYRCGETVTAEANHQYSIVKNDEGYYSYTVENCEDDGFYAWTVAITDDDDNVTGYDCYAKECVFCHETTAVTKKATGHKWEWTKVVEAATCTETGTLAHGKCTNVLCTAEEGTEDIEATGHNIKTKATCTEDTVCKDCGKLEGTALGHTFERAAFDTTDLDVEDSATWDKFGYIPAQEATCTTIGWNAHFRCTDCGVFGEYVEEEALGHDYGIVAATSNSCTEDGMKAHYVCMCDCCEGIVWSVKTTTEKANVEPKDVVYDDNGKVTYYTVGAKTTVASLTVKATGHKFNTKAADYVKPQAAKCEQDGCTVGGTCTNCNTPVRSEVIPALGHDGDRETNRRYDEEGNMIEDSFKLLSSSSKRATCQKEAYCGICGKTQSKWVDLDARNYLTSWCDEEGAFVAKKSATCEAEGASMDYTICACGCIKVDGSAVKEYKKDADGNDTDTVKSYWSKSDVVIAKKAHSYDIKIDAKAPTCTEDGWNEYYICRFCGAVKGSIKTIAKLGHCNADEGKTCQTAFNCERVVRYETDENGEVKKDENGEPIVAEVCGEHYVMADPSKAKSHSYEKRDTGSVDEKGNAVYAYICTGCGAKKED